MNSDSTSRLHILFIIINLYFTGLQTRTESIVTKFNCSHLADNVPSHSENLTVGLSLPIFNLLPPSYTYSWYYLATWCFQSKFVTLWNTNNIDKENYLELRVESERICWPLLFLPAQKEQKNDMTDGESSKNSVNNRKGEYIGTKIFVCGSCLSSPLRLLTCKVPSTLIQFYSFFLNAYFLVRQLCCSSSSYEGDGVERLACSLSSSRYVELWPKGYSRVR